MKMLMKQFTKKTILVKFPSFKGYSAANINKGLAVRQKCLPSVESGTIW